MLNSKLNQQFANHLGEHSILAGKLTVFLVSVIIEL